VTTTHHRSDLRWRARIDVALLVLCGLAALAIVGALGPARPVVVLLAALFVPGGAALTLLDVSEPLSAAALAVGLSLSLEIAGSLAIVWTTYWHPVVLALVLGAASVALLARDLARRASGLRGPAE
jgi:hypothetical protein